MTHDRSGTAKSEAAHAAGPVGVERRMRVTTAAVLAIALVLILVALILEGVNGAVAPVAFALLFTLPGGLVRRCVVPQWRLGALESILVDLVVSCAALVVFGAVMAASGSLTSGPVSVLGIAAIAALVVGVRRRGGVNDEWLTAVRAWAVFAAIGAVGVCLFHVEPRIGDRIYLGQLRTSVEVLQAGRIPSTSWTFGAETPFPFNYVFFNVIFAVVGAAGRLASWPAWERMSAVLRMLQLSVFVMAWYLVGREMLRRFRNGYLAWACSVVLPVILLYNLALRNKFRAPLIEGFAIAILGIAMWSAMRMTAATGTERRTYGAVSGLSVALMIGIHLPVFIEAVGLIGAWLLVARVPSPPETSETSERSARTSPPRLARRSPVRRRIGALFRWLMPFAISSAGAIALLGFLTGTNPFSPAADAVSPRLAFRAYLFYLGEPLSRASIASFQAPRLGAAYTLVRAPYSGVTVVLAIIGGLGLLFVTFRDRSTWRIMGWWLLAAVFTSVYAALGFYFGRTDVTPWNAVTRNAFYIWVPIAFAICFGVRAVASLVEGRAGRRHRRGHRSRRTGRSAVVALLATAILVIVLQPMQRDLIPVIREFGWIQQSALTADGQNALVWVSRHTPRNAVVMTSEQTSGTNIITDRRSITEGYATLESRVVTSRAVKTLGAATEFFLPVHSPVVLSERNVQYLISGGPGLYGEPKFGGVPLIVKFYETILPAIGLTPLEGLPYLRPVYRSGVVTVYRVDRERLPTVTEFEVRGEEAPPPCATDVCIIRRHIDGGECPAEQTSAEPGVCLISAGRSAVGG